MLKYLETHLFEVLHVLHQGVSFPSQNNMTQESSTRHIPGWVVLQGPGGSFGFGGCVIWYLKNVPFVWCCDFHQNIGINRWIPFIKILESTVECLCHHTFFKICSLQLEKSVRNPSKKKKNMNIKQTTNIQAQFDQFGVPNQLIPAHLVDLLAPHFMIVHAYHDLLPEKR